MVSIGLNWKIYLLSLPAALVSLQLWPFPWQELWSYNSLIFHCLHDIPCYRFHLCIGTVPCPCADGIQRLWNMLCLVGQLWCGDYLWGHRPLLLSLSFIIFVNVCLQDMMSDVLSIFLLTWFPFECLLQVLRGGSTSCVIHERCFITQRELHTFHIMSIIPGLWLVFANRWTHGLFLPWHCRFILYLLTNVLIWTV